MQAEFMASLLNMLAGAKRRETEEHEQFLDFYARLVMSISNESASIFGNMGKVKVKKNNKIHDPEWGIELNPVDLAWWRTKIMQEGYRFVHGPDYVKADMLQRVNDLMKNYKLTEEERLFFMTEGGIQIEAKVVTA